MPTSSEPGPGREAVERLATTLAGPLSDGRRSRAVLDEGTARAFRTDLAAIAVPFPRPTRSVRELACALALQASPSKESVASVPWPGFRRRHREALAWVEGEAAVRWAARRWPGLAPELRRLFPWVAPGDPELDGGRLVEAARGLARLRRVERPPALLGGLPQRAVAEDARRRRTFIATRWSSRHRARREGSLPVPASGPATERVVHPGDPGTIEALDGRPGHELGIPYDEWDHRRAGYRQRYVRVLELDGSGTPGPLVAPLPLPELSAARSRRRHCEDGELDVDAVVRWRCDHEAGTAPGSPSLFAQLTPVRGPGAWVLLVDASASSSTGGGEVLRRATAQADAMARSLSERGELVGVMAFRSHARERVEIRVLKRFDRPYAPLPRERPAGYTRLGAAIRHAGRRLLDTPARARALVYLGDAVPYDEGYGEAYGRADVAMAVSELRARGVVVRHSSSAAADEGSLDEMFGPGGWRGGSAPSDAVGLVADVQHAFAMAA